MPLTNQVGSSLSSAAHVWPNLSLSPVWVTELLSAGCRGEVADMQVELIVLRATVPRGKRLVVLFVSF